MNERNPSLQGFLDTNDRERTSDIGIGTDGRKPRASIQYTTENPPQNSLENPPEIPAKNLH